MMKAKAGLKRALEKANNLEKDDFRQIKQWLRKDEDTSVITVMFLERMRKEIKRSLKVTIDTINHPESLGAYRRRHRSSVQAYPSLPATLEVTEESSTIETEKWVNDNCDRTLRTNSNAAIKPPVYSQTIEPSQNIIKDNSQMLQNQHPSHDAHQPEPPAVNMQYNGTPALVPEPHQAQTTGSNSVPSREETLEEKRERKKQQLTRRKVPEDLWEYYLESPESWNFDDVTKDGLQKGISAILIAPHNSRPMLG